MSIPDSYSPLETMEKLLLILSEGLGLTDEDLIRLASEELSPQVLERSPLERMEEMCNRLEQQYAAQRGKV